MNKEEGVSGFAVFYSYYTREALQKTLVLLH